MMNKQMKGEISMPDLIDFLALSRKFIRQAKIYSKMDIPEEYFKLIKEAAHNVSAAAELYDESEKLGR